MSDAHPHDEEAPEVALARHVDAICRRFEADWRAGRIPAISDYLGEIAEEGRGFLRAELEALESELRQADEAATVAQASLPTFPIPGMARPSVHEDATVAPRDDATVDLGPPGSTQTEASSPTHVRYFGDYEIIREIARGGMGVVFQARQVSLNRLVALKMILAGQLANDTDVKRFYTEAEAAANLDHPGIVPIYEVGQHQGQHYFSMGFIEGQSLSQRLAEGPLPPGDAAELMKKVAESIEYAHQHGVIHRDLKPANILLDSKGNPRVTDFGLAKKREVDSGLTGSGQIMGTPSYMPPEQTGGKRSEIGPAADVYSLGATLYAMITGRPPFQAATPMDTLIQVVGDEPVPPRRLNASIPRDLETICLKCLEKEPGKRYSSAAAMEEDLRRYLAGEPIAARPVRAWERAWKLARRRPVVAGLAAALLLATILGIAGITWQWRKAEQNFALAEVLRSLAEENARVARVNERKARESARTEAAARTAAENAAEAEKAAKIEAQRQQVRAEWLLYASKITLAQRELEADNVNAAAAVLKSTRPDFRSWEYDYLQTQFEANQIVCKVPSIDAISRDGKRLASSDYRLGRWGVTVWDMETGKLLVSLQHSGPVRAAAFSADGTRLACGGNIANKHDKPADLKVWNLETGKVIFELEGHVPGVAGVCYSPDGKRISSLAGNLFGKSAELKVWDAQTGKEVLNLQVPAVAGLFGRGIVGGLAYSPDGKRIAAGMAQQLNVWDAESGKVILSFSAHHYAIKSLAYSPDGKRIATTSYESKIKLWDAETGKELLAIPNDGGEDIAFSPDGKRIASTSGQLVKVWDALTGKEVRSIKTGASAGLAFILDGKRLAIAAGGTVGTWEIDKRQRGLTFEAGKAGISSMALSPDGQRIATSSALLDPTVKVWDTQTGKLVFNLKGHGDFASSLAFSRDGKTLASTSRDGTTRIWDMNAGENKRTLKSGFRQCGVVALGPKGDLLATNQDDKTVTIWDLKSGKPTFALPAATESVLSLAFSFDGKYLACGGSGVRDKLKVWNVQTGQVAFTRQGQNVFSVAFSPDGQYLASAGMEDKVRVWNSKTGDESFVLQGHIGPIKSVTFSPDGKRIATAGSDGTIRLWEAQRGFETIRLPALRERQAAAAVAFSSDGQRLACAGLYGTVRIWDTGWR
jgi:eukaryotic-like serine/threonine-protein kinase